MNNLKNIISDNESSDIIKTIIIPNIRKDIKQLSSTPRMWRNISNLSQTLSHITAAIGIIFSFCSAAYGISDWGIYGGISSTMSVIFNKFGDYAKKESKERTDELNLYLNGIMRTTALPDLTAVMNDDDENEIDIEKGNATILTTQT
jgi:hypothetical protein